MAASHYSIMTKETSALFVAGPPVVNQLINDPAKHRDRFELGGWEIQTRCGAVDHAADREEEAFECTRRFLSYLPSSVFEVAPRGARTDDPDRREEFLFEAIPRDKRKVYKMRPIIDAVVDKGSFFEMGRMFGRPIITGFARIDGLPVALMASDPFFYGGAWTAAAHHPQGKIAVIDERLQKLRSPFRTAEPFWIEEIIDPRDTRKLLVEFAGYAEKLRQPGESKFCMRP